MNEAGAGIPWSRNLATSHRVPQSLAYTLAHWAQTSYMVQSWGLLCPAPALECVCDWVLEVLEISLSSVIPRAQLKE